MPTAGDLLIRATDLWAQHAMTCDEDQCEPCIVAINQLRLAYKVWQSSAPSVGVGWCSTEGGIRGAEAE